MIGIGLYLDGRASVSGADPDAAAYIAAVEAAGGVALEQGIRDAYTAFITGCKSDGNWPALKVCGIVAGAGPLAGALVPVVGPAPINHNFVAGDYDRLTGLVGDGSTKWLDTGWNNNADPQDNRHLAIYISTRGNQGSPYIGTASSNGGSLIRGQNVGGGATLPSANLISMLASPAAGQAFAGAAQNDGVFIGVSRSSSGGYAIRANEQSASYPVASVSPLNANYAVLRRGTENVFGNSRFAFYSAGESLDLVQFERRVLDLMAAIESALVANEALTTKSGTPLTTQSGITITQRAD